MKNTRLTSNKSAFFSLQETSIQWGLIDFFSIPIIDDSEMNQHYHMTSEFPSRKDPNRMKFNHKSIKWHRNHVLQKEEKQGKINNFNYETLHQIYHSSLDSRMSLGFFFY